MKLAGSTLALAACALPAPKVAPPPPPERVAIVLAEGVGDGFRLVAIDERGDRRFALIAPAGTHDTDPAISPDGTWVAFARRVGDHKQLFVAPLGAEQPARPLTDAIALDTSPAWTPDGRAIVFASTRGGTFDLWRVSIAGGAPEKLTSGEGHEVAPAVARDGAIYYTSVQQVRPDSAEVTSRIEERLPSGETRAVTAGPGDVSPAISPDGSTLVFARQIETEHDLMTLDLTVAGAEPASLVRLPLTDEAGPVWSRDGAFVLATSILRGDDGRAVFTSVIAIDRRERVARILEDRAGAAPRLSPAIAPVPLDAAALRADPEYLPELARVVQRAIEDQQK